VTYDKTVEDETLLFDVDFFIQRIPMELSMASVGQRRRSDFQAELTIIH